MGYSVRHTVESCSPGSKKAHVVSKEQQVLVPNRQPAIIRLEQFANVNGWLDERAEKNSCKNVKQQRVSALYKKVYCMNCGCALTRRKDGNYDVYICLDKRENPLSDCLSEPIKTVDLEAAVFEALQFNIKLLVDNKKRLKRFLLDNIVDSQEDLSNLRNTVEKISHKKTELYGEYKSGQLTKERYINKKEELSKQIFELEKKILRIEENINKHNEGNILFNSDYARLVDKFKEEKFLSPNLADAFVEKVFVDEKQNIKIIFKFQNEIDKIGQIKLS